MPDDILERLRRPFGVHEISLRNWCLEAADKIERLQGEKSYLEDEVIPHLRSEVERLSGKCEELEEALQQIAQWAEAYPFDIFHEPSVEECRKAHELLTANGMTLDAFSASATRSCLKGIGVIARRALKRGRG